MNINVNTINNIGVMNNYTNKFLKNKNTNLNSEHNASTICHAYYPAFKGNIPLTKLVNDYKWFINKDNLPAINSVLKIDAPKESIDSLLRFILNDDKLSIDFFNSITDQKRSNAHFYRALYNKLPSNSDILNTLHPYSPYHKAYSKYIDTRYNEAKSICELLQIRPDWKEEVLLKKHKNLTYNDSFEMGTVPKSIGKENFETLIYYLRSHSQFGFKIHKEIPDLHVNGKTFKIETFIDGKSDKNVFTVQAETGKKYVIKIAEPEKRSLDNPFALGTLAKIDTYLTRNNCRNSARIRYYNHDLNVAIYDYINHVKVPRTFDVSNSGKRIPDFIDLGMRQSDTVGTNNYFKLDGTQTCLKDSFDFEYGILHDELISVDNDHATYTNVLTPKVDKYHKELPEAMNGMFL